MRGLGGVIETIEAGSGALLCAPMVAFGTPVGTLDVDPHWAREWSAADCPHAEQSAGVLGRVFERLLTDVRSG
jgi:hypothetical protein